MADCKTIAGFLKNSYGAFLLMSRLQHLCRSAGAPMDSGLYLEGKRQLYSKHIPNDIMYSVTVDVC